MMFGDNPPPAVVEALKIYECRNAQAAVALRDLICGEIEEAYAAAIRRLAAVPDPE